MERRAIGPMPWNIGAFSMGKSWENHGKMGKSWENHGKMVGKWWENGNIMELQNRASSSMSNSKSMFCSKNIQIKNIVDIDVWSCRKPNAINHPQNHHKWVVSRPSSVGLYMIGFATLAQFFLVDSHFLGHIGL